MNVSIHTLVLFCALSAFPTLLLCLASRWIGNATGLIDHPDGALKVHSQGTPLIGGLAVLIPTFLVSFLYLGLFDHAGFLGPALAVASLILLVGVFDDHRRLSVRFRFLAIALFAIAAFIAEPYLVIPTLRLETLGVEIPLGLLAVPVTLVMIVGFVNATNMADGMNGQLLGSTIIWSLLIIFYLPADAVLPFAALIASSLVGLVFNLRGQVFSGSAGSYGAPFFIGLGAIAAYRLSEGTMNGEIVFFWFWLPVIDCLRVSAQRLRERRSPFAGDRIHFHHFLAGSLNPHVALGVYLILLGTPGAVAVINETLGGAAFLVSFLGYSLIVAFANSNQRSVRSLQFVTRPGWGRIGRRSDLE